jgi:glycerol-3-phosphate acyltransferase PlsY
LFGLAWPIGLLFCLIWLATAALTRYSSLAALVASAATPIALWLSGWPPAALLFAVLTLLLFTRHRENMARLLSGTEGKIGGSAAAP